jgi:hypothetical protein
MKKNLFRTRLIAAFLCCATTLTVPTACSDNDADLPNLGPDIPPTEEPTTDALSVTTDEWYVLYGEWEDDFGKALGRRLQRNSLSPTDAGCYVITPLAIQRNSISTDEWKHIVRRCMSGEASIVLTQCTFKEFYNFGEAYVLAVMSLELDNYQGDALPEVAAEARARAKRQVTSMVHNAYMAGNHDSDAATRSAGVNGQQMDWEDISQWPEEKQQAIMFDAYAFCSNNEIYVLNAVVGSNETAEQPDTDYEWGHKADAIADWLNRQSKRDSRTHKALSAFRQSLTRAGESANISDLMDAQIKEFVFDYKYPRPGGDPTDAVAYSAIKVQYKAYSAYDFTNNVEYYQVRQNITVMNEKIFMKPEDNWTAHSGTTLSPGDWNARGAWMKSIDTKMWLEGNGSKSIMSVGPLNENGTSSGSSSVGGGTTETTGGSKGFSVGISGGASGKTPVFSINGSYSQTWTYSNATSTTWGTSTNWSTKDLTTNFTQDNDSNATVIWKHIGKTPTEVELENPSNVKALLRNTCVTDEQTLWKVENPSGTYTLKASFCVVSEICKVTFNGSSNTVTWPNDSNSYAIDFVLDTPDRYKRMWNNVIYDYGITPEGMSQIEYTGYLDDFIEKAYGNNSANFCWATFFISTEAAPDSSANARAVFQTFKNSIQGMKQQLKKKGIKGQLTFGLKPDGVDVQGNPYDLIDQITINLDN